MNSLINALLHPLFIALFLGSFIILLLPDMFGKFEISPKWTLDIPDGDERMFDDLDSDGNSEWILTGTTELDKPYIAVHRLNMAYLYMVLDYHFLPGQSRCVIADVDADDVKEICVFVFIHDSLFISIISYKYRNFLLKNHYLTTINGVSDVKSVSLYSLQSMDITGDSLPEVLFYISNGFGIKPRKIFAFDVANKILISSPELGGHIINVDAADVDYDGLPEFTVTNYGPGNIVDKSLPMRDSSAYLIALDSNLDFLFDPIEFPGVYTGITSLFIPFQNEFKILSCRGYNDSIEKGHLRIYNLDGTLLKEITDNHDYTGLSKQVISSNGKSRIVATTSRNDYQLLDLDDFKEIRVVDITAHNPLFQFFDFNGDGTQEILVRGTNSDNWYIYDCNLQNPVPLNTVNTGNSFTFYPVLDHQSPPAFGFQINDVFWIFEYKLNPLYKLRYVIYFFVYAILFAFILLIRKLQRYQLQKKSEIEDRILELQLLSIRNQLDPHFTFNALNTISSAIVQGHIQEADTLLLKFSRLLRSTLEDSESSVRRLEVEIEFTRNYLDIQMLRFKQLFEYSLYIAPDVPLKMMVPKSCIQNYAENAIKHGISPKMKDGLVEIDIRCHDEFLCITITDNGIGRRAAYGISNQSTGKGTYIMNQYYKLLNSRNRVSIQDQIIDLYDSEGNATGTQVKIQIPLDLQPDQKVSNNYQRIRI